jgi:hypothetical protein
MPPKARQNQKNPVEQEGKILLAVSDLKNKRISSVQAAVHVYQVPESTL